MFDERSRLAPTSGCIALAGAVACVLQAGSALAAAPPAASSALQEIVVTAQRTQTSLQETPVSITAFSGDALRESGITSLLEIGAFTPNLQVGTRSGSAGEGGFAIRGMGVSSTESSPAVGIYVDDVYFPSSAGNLLGLFDVERVEVLRGPQGTLFGRNTIAGAVQYISVKPSFDGVSGFVEGTGGNFGRADFSGALNAPLGDTLALRLSVASRERDGYVHDDLNNLDRGSDDTKQGRLQLRWTPTDKLSIDLKAEAVSQESNGRAFTVAQINANTVLVRISTGQIPGPPTIPETRPYNSSLLLPSSEHYRIRGLNAPEFFEFDYKIGQATISYKLTDTISLTSISAYSKSTSDYGTDVDGVPISIISTTGHEEIELFTEELRLSGSSFGGAFNWTTGAYYYDEVRSTGAGTFRLGNGSSLPFQLGQSNRAGAISDLSSKAYALYAQGTYDLTDRLSGTLGLRYSSEEVEFKEFPPFLGPLQLSSIAKFTDTSPYVGLNFQVNPDLMAFVKASKGFRAGGNQVVSQFPLPSVMVPFEQETAWTYEIGTRMEFMDRRLRINPTVFYTDWTDIQFNALNPIGIPYTYNAGDATIKGAELEMLFAATDRWLLNGSVSFLDGHYTRINPAILASGELTLDDDMQQAPEKKYTAGVRYTLPLGNDGRIVANANYAWVDTIRSAVTRPTTVQLPSYSLVNAQVQYVAPNDRWSVTVFGTNLTDEYYLSGGVSLLSGPGALLHDPARPREYGATLRFNF